MAPPSSSSSSSDASHTPQFGAVRQSIDEESLKRFITSNEATKHIKMPLEVKQAAFGQSNPTMLLTDAEGQRYILRKKPPGKLVSKTAHAVEREYRIIKAIGQYNDSLANKRNDARAVPVPDVYCLCEDVSVLGTPFYIMQFVEGRIFTDARMLSLPKEQRRQCWYSALRTLANMHRIDPTTIGLGDYGKRQDFYQRQLRGLSMVSSMQAQVCDKDTGKEVGAIPHMDELIELLSAKMVADENGITHGDYKIDNLIYHPTESRVIAVLDWELSTLGHPLSDLANLLQPFSMPCPNPAQINDPDEVKRAQARGEMFMLLGNLTDEQSPVPQKAELMQVYCQSVGRVYPIPGWSFCEAWAWFRAAVISHGIAARVAGRQASSAEAKMYATKYPHAAQAALDLLRKPDDGQARSKL
jgi:aminoglycoside phosphotransferase (APT) family kinase protein